MRNMQSNRRRGYSSASGREQGRGWQGDPQGHAEAAERGWEHRRDDSDEDYGRSSGRRRSSYDDRDEDRSYRGSSRNEGRGWYGDPEGHAEAAERGWEHRRGDYDEDYGRSSRRSSYEDRDEDRSYRSSRRGEGRGWYGDPEGHAEAAEEGWEHRPRHYSDENRPGWYGDPEGHSEAAEEGWSHRRGGSRRSSSNDSDRRYRSRDEDSRSYRSSRGRSQGGWFGDPEGHAEAAERGWEHRGRGRR